MYSLLPLFLDLLSCKFFKIDHDALNSEEDHRNACQRDREILPEFGKPGHGDIGTSRADAGSVFPADDEHDDRKDQDRQIGEQIQSKDHFLRQIRIKCCHTDVYAEYENDNTKKYLDEVISLVKKYEIKDITTVDVTSMTNIFLLKKNGFKLIIGSPENLDYKFRSAVSIMNEHISETDSGTLDVSMADAEGAKSYFKSKDTSKVESSKPEEESKQESSETESSLVGESKEESEISEEESYNEDSEEESYNEDSEEESYDEDSEDEEEYYEEESDEEEYSEDDGYYEEESSDDEYYEEEYDDEDDENDGDGGDEEEYTDENNSE